jgi:hypothetical protein
MSPLKVFIGFDSRAHVAFHALTNSIISRCSQPVSITPLILPTLPISRTGLTQFTFTRFLVPWLCNYEGHALFLDNDIIVQADIAELFELAASDPSKAVWAVDYKDPNLGFERAAVMLFNCAHEDNKKLTPEFVEKAEVPLHKIGWTQNVGALAEEWGHLVMYQNPKQAKLIHYTAGIPIWPETVNLGFAKEWQEEIERAVSAVSYNDLMARSVHHQHVMRIFQEQQKKANAAALAKAAMEQVNGAQSAG